MRMRGCKTNILSGRQAESEKTSKEAPKHETTYCSKDSEDSHGSRGLHPHTDATQCSHTVTDTGCGSPQACSARERHRLNSRVVLSGITEETNDAQKREDHILHPSKQNTNYGWTRRQLVMWLGCMWQEMEQLPPAPTLMPAKNSSFPHYIAATDTTQRHASKCTKDQHAARSSKKCRFWGNQ